MNVFSFDLEHARDAFRSQGWVHIRRGVEPDFLAHLDEFVDEEFASSVVEGRGIAGTKQQAVLPLADDGTLDHLFDVIAGVCDLNRTTMTLSERHFKFYDASTPVEPSAHKDRLSSQVSVGLSIRVPVGSTLVLYPREHLETNPFNVATAFRESLAPELQPDIVLGHATELVIPDQPGDVMIFRGSSTWHKRRQGAGAVNLYLKFNDFDSDPLGEDPSTESRRAATLAALANGAIDNYCPVPARRLDTITRQTTRDPDITRVVADVWGRTPVPLEPEEVELLDALMGRVAAAPLPGLGGTEVAIRRLASEGVLDLV